MLGDVTENSRTPQPGNFYLFIYWPKTSTHAHTLFTPIPPHILTPPASALDCARVKVQTPLVEVPEGAGFAGARASGQPLPFAVPRRAARRGDARPWGARRRSRRSGAPAHSDCTQRGPGQQGAAGLGPRDAGGGPRGCACARRVLADLQSSLHRTLAF